MNEESNKMDPVIYTIGHSTRPLDEFIRILQAHDIALLVDVRSVPRSRHNPQFEKTTLGPALQESGVGYLHMPELGGLRHALADSPNIGWRNLSFRGFADYMQTPAFAGGLEHLIVLAREQVVAIMCAESVPWRCHRSLIGDALLVYGLHVKDIISMTSVRDHTMTPWARVVGGCVTYPATEAAAGDSQDRAVD
jgi:uncharacterized protein (DUF488 family)